ncbi:MAG: hypothetical protein HN855_14700 [Anaerolineae bacterium]|jgi:hypothetical protein|nr:hypothetical protein [Anaerolineae bacterium]MBT7326405.1 hypothetical protein [Anaerolineae bacterium]
MKKIRRIYVYLVAFISMEVLLWGLIGLARSIFSDTVGGGVDALAQALALVLVGALVFGFHWWLAQRSITDNAEEHASAIRAFFLYAAAFALLIPVVQNGLAVLNRLFLDLFEIPVSRAFLGQSQALSDNLIAAIMNAILAAYFINILRSDWAEVLEKSSLTLMRRMYRYLWVFYALVMSIIGVHEILRYLFGLITKNATYLNSYASFANGLAITLVSVPLWAWAWKTVQDSLSEEAERASLFRLGVLYFLSLAGVIFVLSASGVIINSLLQMLLGEIESFKELMQEIAEPLAVAIPLGAVWAYYGGWLKRDIAAIPDAPRRASLHRLYYYILSLIGLSAAFIGIASLLYFFIDSAFSTTAWIGNLNNRLAGALATLFVGLPLWLYVWRPMQSEALALDEAGDHARRSGIRKIYLYIALFAGVVGGMVAAVQLASLLFKALLGASPSSFTNNLLNALQMFILFGGLLTYHWKSLQWDGERQSEILEDKLAEFSVVFFAKDGETLSPQLASAIEKESQGINLIVQPLDEALSAETRENVHAVILPEDVALDPPEKLGMWLRQFNGSKLILTSDASDAQGWLWMQTLSDTAKALRQLAEGEAVSVSSKSPGWMIAVYILAGLMGLQILFFLIVMTVDSLGL